MEAAGNAGVVGAAACVEGIRMMGVGVMSSASKLDVRERFGGGKNEDDGAAVMWSALLDGRPVDPGRLLKPA